MSSTLDLLFDPSGVIPSEIQAEYPAGYTVRPLARDDFCRGFLECLQDLTWMGNISEESFCERFDWQKKQGHGWYYCIVIVDDAANRIIGTGVVVVEKKLYVSLSLDILQKFHEKKKKKRDIKSDQSHTEFFPLAFIISASLDISKMSQLPRITKANILANDS